MPQLPQDRREDGVDLGPELSQIGRKYDRAKLLESILEPSKNIEPKYVTWMVETTAGQVLAGLLVRKDGNEIVIKDSQNKEHRIAMGDVENTYQLQHSLMPELLLRDFTPQQVADLLAYLASLKVGQAFQPDGDMRPIYRYNVKSRSRL